MKPKKLSPPERPRKKTPQQVPPLPAWLFDEADTLRDMIAWWKSREAAAMDAAERRPVFLGKTRNTGIRINEVILGRAVAKSRQERLKTGGNLSQLVEWLMWIYIGSPDDVVERLNTDQ